MVQYEKYNHRQKKTLPTARLMHNTCANGKAERFGKTLFELVV
jgi:hypothetical protein